MAELENDKQVKTLLDSLLTAYSDVQPRPGFQTRLLANLQADPRLQAGAGAKGVNRWLWAAVTAIALIAITLTVRFWHLPALPAEPKIEAAGVPALPATIEVGPHITNPRPTNRLAAPQENSVAVAEVRQAVFPTPTPLSDQERLLLRYLAGTPKEEVAIQSRSDEPVEGPEQLVPQVQQFPAVEKYSTR